MLLTKANVLDYSYVIIAMTCKNLSSSRKGIMLLFASHSYRSRNWKPCIRL